MLIMFILPNMVYTCIHMYIHITGFDTSQLMGFDHLFVRSAPSRGRVEQASGETLLDLVRVKSMS
jgi:hypothetical protein